MRAFLRPRLRRHGPSPAPTLAFRPAPSARSPPPDSRMAVLIGSWARLRLDAFKIEQDDDMRRNYMPAPSTKPHWATPPNRRRPSVLVVVVAASFACLLVLALSRHQPHLPLDAVPRRAPNTMTSVNPRWGPMGVARYTTDRPRSAQAKPHQATFVVLPVAPASSQPLPPLHLLAEETITTSCSTPTTTTNFTTEEPRREDQEPADWGRLAPSRAAVVVLVFFVRLPVVCFSARHSPHAYTAPYAHRHPDTLLEPSGTSRRQGTTTTGTDADKAPRPHGTDAHHASSHPIICRPSGTYSARIAPTLTTHPRPQLSVGHRAPTPPAMNCLLSESSWAVETSPGQ
ncbi:hypothetical protein DFH08DRAFT_938987 [Mycena albidolilacea]|uniref:Uncharacterized protein n=1 Tax=Mycena albidolilacea TaxID=1033008 RepID=A0AAD6ZT22_9AGAR|nr:hypothetical protein DFH08DRAFT_938987 [Mycena albidolilacea]